MTGGNAHPDGERMPAGGAQSADEGPFDCDEVLDDVYLFLDDECDAAHRAKIREHIDGCSPCLRQFGIEADLKALLARKCRSEPAPESLRQSVRFRLTEVTFGPSDA